MPRLVNQKDVSAVQNIAEVKEQKKRPRVSKKEVEEVAVVDATVAGAKVKRTYPGHAFYSVWSRSRGWVCESLDPDRACEALDEYYFDWMRKVNYEEKKIIFDYYILKRDTAVNASASEHYAYCPGSFTERKREDYLRAKFGDRYREDGDKGEDFDSSQYVADFKTTKR
jgi:hypothetical protein